MAEKIEVGEFWEPSDPPALEGLKAWCEAEVKEAVTHTIANLDVWLSSPGGGKPPNIVIATDRDILVDGKIDCLHAEIPLFPILEQWLAEGENETLLRAMLLEIGYEP